MRSMAGVGLLASAFAPLVALLGVVRLGAHGAGDVIGWALLAVAAVSLVLLLAELAALRRYQENCIVVTSVERDDERVLRFSYSYLVPVVVAVVGGKDWATMTVAVGMALVLGVVYVRGRLHYLNPVLSLLGYRLYSTTVDRREVMVLSRARRLEEGQELAVRWFSAERDIAIELGGHGG